MERPQIPGIDAHQLQDDPERGVGGAYRAFTYTVKPLTLLGSHDNGGLSFGAPGREREILLCHVLGLQALER